MQTPFLKDLVSLHNPCSHFTFLNFLKQKGRLNEFVALREFFPSRIEFDQYFRWAADQLTPYVRYKKQVLALSPTSLNKNNHFDVIKIKVKNIFTNQDEYFLARNIVLGMGSLPYVPNNCVSSDSKVFH